MNKAQLQETLIKTAATNNVDLSRRAAAVVLDTLFNPTEGIIARQTKKGDVVALAGFGTFGLRRRKARTARNPQTGGAIKVPAQKTVGFKVGQTLKATVNGGQVPSASNGKKAKKRGR